MADKLTPQQEQAVTNRGGKLLVSAAAGSGKTKVLVDRLLSYLTNPGECTNLDDFLIITYTKAAASELRSKIAARLSERISQEPENVHLQRQMQRLYLTKISTIHGFCAELLREYAYRLDVPLDFRIADETECNEIRESVLRKIMTEVYESDICGEDVFALIDTQGLGRDDSKIPELICSVYDNARCHLNPDEWLEECQSQACIDSGDDISVTPWGRFLICNLQMYLDSQISVIAACADSLEKCGGMEKAAVYFRELQFQLVHLRESNTWDDIQKAKKIDYGRLTFPRNNPDPVLTLRVKAARDACKQGVAKRTKWFSDDAAQVKADLLACSSGVRGLIELVRWFDREYSEAKRSRRVMDFSDLEQKTLDLLLGKQRTGPTAAAIEISKRFKEVMVDEYQDSNGVQDAIFSALTDTRKNCFLVGDVKQSIYQFRLADPGIFLEKYNRFASCDHVKPGEGRKVLLSHNFRSGPEVIEAVNAVFRTCMSPQIGGLQYGEEEALREGISHSPLPEPGVELHVIKTHEDAYAEEADYVTSQIRKLLQEKRLIREGDQFRPVKPEDIVILLRSPGSAASYFQHSLETAGIRCVSGNGLNLFDTPEIDTFRSLLLTIQNPRQDIPLISVLASPLFGFTADDLARVRSRRIKGSFYDALVLDNDPRTERFKRILALLRQESRMNTLTGLLEKCIILTDMDCVYAAMSDGEVKNANIQSLFQLASEYENGGLRDLIQFLDYLDSLERKGFPAASVSGQAAVRVMSIHKSKGLEFPVVFLSNLSRKFNMENLNGQILCDRDMGIGLTVVDHTRRFRYSSISKRAIAAKMESECISEEMRILYVAMTRARDRLVMTYASKSVETDLKQIAARKDFDSGKLICMEASCPGDWVLLTALGRTEAGALQAICECPVSANISEYPWKICFQESSSESAELCTTEEHPIKMPEGAMEYLRRALSFHYPYEAATMAPSKRTATDRKGRVKDEEAYNNTPDPKYMHRIWRKPAFRNGKINAAAYGSAIHLALQYIRYENCDNLRSVEQEIERLEKEGFLTKEQAEMVDCKMLFHFFSTEIGNKLVRGVPCLREFKFSILDDGKKYGEQLNGEKVLLQGVIDCALIEDGGITVIDFKTDHVTEETLRALVCRYRPQVEAYAEALSRIYDRPVKKKLLYFFQIGRFEPV